MYFEERVAESESTVKQLEKLVKIQSENKYKEIITPEEFTQRTKIANGTVLCMAKGRADKKTK